MKSTSFSFYLIDSLFFLQQFGCANGACVPLLALCNGQDECGDYSDEASCNVNECENPYTCAQICKDKGNFPVLALQSIYLSIFW